MVGNKAMKILFLLFLMIAGGSSALAQTQTLLPGAETQFVDANGVPYAGGAVYMYVPFTTTPKATWKDPNGTTLNSNPIILDSAGRGIIWGGGLYRQVLQDQFGNTIWDQQVFGQAPGLFTTLGASSLIGNPTGTAGTPVGIGIGPGLTISGTAPNYLLSAGAPVYTSGAQASGTVNAIIVPTVTPGGFTLVAGTRVSFLASGANTGATTLAVGGTTATGVEKDVNGTLVALAGGEIAGAGQVVETFYDGTEWQLIVPGPGVPTGAIMGFNATTCPLGWLAADGTNSTLNMTGVVARGYDPTGARDASGTAVGGFEADWVHSFSVQYEFYGSSSGVAAGAGFSAPNQASAGAVNATITGIGTTGVETRVKATVVLYCEKN